MAHPIVYGPADCSYVWSARLAPAERGVTHEFVDVPFGPHREQTHLSRQPFAKRPAFEHDGFTLYETQAIVRYVDERFPGRHCSSKTYTSITQRATFAVSSNPSLADHVFSLSPEDQVVLGKCGEGIGHRLLRGFVPLQTHTFKDFAPAKTGRMFPDDP